MRQHLDGTLNGEGGTDTLDYSAYTTGVTVNLSTSSTLINIENPYRRQRE